MMGRIIGSSLKARRVVAVAAGALIIFGVWQLRSARVDSLPEFAPPTVEVRTEALGLSAPEVEQLITVPLEQDLLAGVPWLDTVRSASIPGLSSIQLVFDEGTNVLRARQAVQERLTQAAGLPNVSAPPQMLQPRSSTSRIMMIRISSGTVSPIDMSVLTRWTIRPRLLGVPGVANVSVWGFRDRQLQVQVDPERLASHGLSLQQIIETSGNALWASPLTFLEANTPGTGGFIDTAGGQRLQVQHRQPIATAADLAQVPIEGGRGTRLRLGDVANVVEDHQPLIGDAVFTDGDPGLLLVVEKFPGANTLDVTRGVDEALDALRPGLSGIRVDATIYRPATYIEQGIRNLGSTLLIGALLLILVLGAVLFEWRSVLIAMVAVLASLTAAWLVLFVRGATINTMVIAGLVMALVVLIDDAITDVDNITRRLRQQRMNGAEQPVARTVLQASLEMRGPLMYATLMTFVAVVPLFFLQGVASPFLPPIVLSFGLAILASMAVALIVTPALGIMLLPGVPLERRGSLLLGWLRRGYDRLLSGTLRRPGRVYAGALALGLAGLVALPFLPDSPIPSFRDGTVLIDWKAPPGTSLPEMDRITGRVGNELASLSGVRDVGASIGRAVTSDQIVDVANAQLWVSIDPGADYDATLSSIRRVVDGYPGIDHTVRTYSDERIGTVLPGTESPIVVRIYGEDLGILRTKAEEVVHGIAGIDGIVHPSIELQPQEPTVNVAVDLTRADRYGIRPGDVRRAAATLMSGIGVGSLFDQQKVFDVVVWGTPATRASLSSVRSLLIDTLDGGHVRLGKVADVSVGPTPTVIRHQDLSRSIDVTADVQGRDVGAVAADVQTRLRGVRFPLEYHAEMIGDYAKRQAEHRKAIAVAIAAGMGIFLLLQAAFGSWRLARAASVAVPLALTGGVLAMLVGDRAISLGSLIGLFAVLAISMRSCTVLIRHYQHLERDEGSEFGPALVERGSRERFAPIVGTALAAGLALLPLAVSGGAAGQELVRPMAVVILGGLVTSTLVGLFVVPSFYLRTGSAPAPSEAPNEVIVLPEVDHVPGS